MSEKKKYTRRRNFKLSFTRHRSRTFRCRDCCVNSSVCCKFKRMGSGKLMYLRGVFDYTVHHVHSLSFNNKQKSKVFFQGNGSQHDFLLIAGTYTPITLYFLNGAIGWVLFAVVWAAAIIGIVMNSVNLEKARIPSVFC